MPHNPKPKKKAQSKRLRASERPKKPAKSIPPKAHIEGERFRLHQPMEVRLTEDDSGVHVPNRIQLFRTGTFKKLMPDGKSITFSITRETLQEMVENFKNKVRGTDIALDFAHKSDEEAAGWFRNLVIEDFGHESQLWAEIDWTTDGYAAVGGKKFRYISPDFAFAWKDNETGEQYGATLFGAGLTNRPVIKHMAPTVELMEVHEMEDKDLELLKKQLAEQGKIIEKLNLRLDEMAADADDDEDDDDADRSASADDSGDGTAKKKTAAQKTKSVDEMSMDELKNSHQKLFDELSELKKGLAKQLAEATKNERSTRFQMLLSEGKAVPAQREAFLAGDMDKFTALAEAPKFTTIGAEGNYVMPKNTSAQEEVLKLAHEKVQKGKAKPSEAVGLVLSENPELNQRYIKEMNDEPEAARARA